MPVTAETLRKHSHNRIFVETGALQGDGIQAALDAGYSRVVSVEISHWYVQFCRNRFKDRPEVVLVQGDSCEALAGVLKDIEEPVTFWLDGHCVWDGVTQGRYAFPLYQELEQIRQHPVKTHTILIDDIRLFTASNPWGIEVSALREKVMQINPDYRIEFVDGCAPGDILVAFLG